MAPIVPARRTWAMDWAMGSILLSAAGVGISLLDNRLFVVGLLFFLAGLIVGIVALLKGVRRNWAIAGVLLNAVNLLYDAAIAILARPT